MSKSIIFDTHRFVKGATDAGLTPSVAEFLADEYAQLLDSNLATKTDLARFEARIIKWNVGATFTFGGLILAAIKFL